ncbi:acetyltransferase (GNAT) domain-containing protein [Hirsutella rhossiliensis]|uniref:Acetyltransferase (GNAT) domain-containing protein n=1 Tax=Hirsutella rhossiliensis TaxID=111463 RepID=A0A9P8MP06_9HYPO|nr:acetyltransferase (GNAT) domain-containing protein [Hirsutella rhossiliensis]KAH0957899.1 acetyltransferase (GNAT) domain-containing protein [Hirsutella rhossiliensis]
MHPPHPPAPLEWTTVSTTLPASPLPPLASRPEIRTARLVLRRTLASDLAAWHAMRSQPEVMTWTSQGAPDRDEAWSRERLARRLAPEADAQYDFAICLADTGEMVGVGGCHRTCGGGLGWPVLGYMLRREFWGHGYATEFLAALLDAWWALPRVPVPELRVERSTVDAVGGGDGSARECIVAVTLDANSGSQRVLDKCKLELVKVWEEPDLRDPDTTATLYAYVARRPGH